jgi:hypothetical protein
MRRVRTAEEIRVRSRPKFSRSEAGATGYLGEAEGRKALAAGEPRRQNHLRASATWCIVLGLVVTIEGEGFSLGRRRASGRPFTESRRGLVLGLFVALAALPGGLGHFSAASAAPDEVESEWPEPLRSPRTSRPAVPFRSPRSDAPSFTPPSGRTEAPSAPRFEPRPPIPCVQGASAETIRDAFDVAQSLLSDLGAAPSPDEAPLALAARKARWASSPEREALVQAAFYRDWPSPSALASSAREILRTAGREPGVTVLERLVGAGERLSHAERGD